MRLGSVMWINRSSRLAGPVGMASVMAGLILLVVASSMVEGVSTASAQTPEVMPTGTYTVISPVTTAGSISTTQTVTAPYYGNSGVTLGGTPMVVDQNGNVVPSDVQPAVTVISPGTYSSTTYSGSEPVTNLANGLPYPSMPPVAGSYCTDSGGGQIFVPAGTDVSSDLSCGAGGSSATVYATLGSGPTAMVELNSRLGPILTDANGRTLYVFNEDSMDASNCTAANGCSSLWPAVQAPAGALVQPSGVSGTLGVMTRDDGTMQLTYNGMPLYYYAMDTNPGDANGVGMPGWSVVQLFPGS